MGNLIFPDPKEVEDELNRQFPYHQWRIEVRTVPPGEDGIERMAYVATCVLSGGGNASIHVVMNPSLRRGKYNIPYADFARDALIRHILMMRTRLTATINTIEAKVN